MTKISRQYRDKIRKRLLDSADVKRKAAEACLDSILEAAQMIINTFEAGNKVMICGNGGSAADSQHMAGEFVCTLNKTFDRTGLPAIALTTDTSVITAIANDFNFDRIFERQIQSLGKPKDLLIGISTSGNSKNVLNALKMAKSLKLKTIALTGQDGISAETADIIILVPSSNTQYIQESHLTIEHILCELVEHYLFNKKGKLWS